MRIRNVLAAVAVAVMAAIGIAVPASASAHQAFAVVDNHGVLVTAQPLVPGQVVLSDGIAHIVVGVSGGVFRIIPALPVSDWGKTFTFVT
jgi:hypothetical protein